MAGPSGLTADVPGVPVTDLEFNSSRTYIGVIPVLFTFSTLILTLRIASRWKPRLEADDYLVVAAAVSDATVSFSNPC
jgi:hypothetical protein